MRQAQMGASGVQQGDFVTRRVPLPSGPPGFLRGLEQEGVQSPGLGLQGT